MWVYSFILSSRIDFNHFAENLWILTRWYVNKSIKKNLLPINYHCFSNNMNINLKNDLSSVQNEKIAPILCANSHNKCSPVFALKLSFIMILDLVLPLNAFWKGLLCQKMYWAIIEWQQIFSAKTDEHKGLSTMFSFKNGDRFFDHCLDWNYFRSWYEHSDCLKRASHFEPENMQVSAQKFHKNPFFDVIFECSMPIFGNWQTFLSYIINYSILKR